MSIITPTIAAPIRLLQSLIATPSYSRQEAASADLIEAFLQEAGVATERLENNVYARSRHWQEGKPVILLNSHHDTVKPVDSWQRDPFRPDIESGKLYGLGSNDAGGSLVALIACFLHFYQQKDLPYNLILAATAEEEISGAKGIALLLPKLEPIALGIVGEPTQMRMAIAEKGLMVIDGLCRGVAGHAARQEGDNALYKAVEAIQQIRGFTFERVSDLLGPTLVQVTGLAAGSQHNVVPDRCSFVIDLRSNELYSNQEAFDLLQAHVAAELSPRSFRLNSSRIPLHHPLVQRGLQLGLPTYGSPTLSDQALMPFTTLKIGCGKSERSHTADEFIYLSEIEKGIEVYIQLLNGLQL